MRGASERTMDEVGVHLLEPGILAAEDALEMHRQVGAVRVDIKEEVSAGQWQGEVAATS